MKQFRIQHETVYQFPSLVQLLPHTLRIRPREGHDLRIVSSSLTLSPVSKLIWHRDVEGNSVASASFAHKAQELKIDSDITLEKYDESPFDFLVEECAVMFPFRYSEDDQISLSPYMRVDAHSRAPALKPWLDAVYSGNENIQSISLLLRINTAINQAFRYIKREEEGVQSAQQTLTSGAGSCRDFAYLFMEAVQSLGFAARFVSGYVFSNIAPDRSGSTHAWAEVFIPGAGWKGFDPTFGVLVGADHISVAVARRPQLVPPVEGKYYGAPGAEMKVFVSVSMLNPSH